MNKEEQEIIESTKEFAKAHNIHYDQMTENMILNAMRELLNLHGVSDSYVKCWNCKHFTQTSTNHANKEVGNCGLHECEVKDPKWQKCSEYDQCGLLTTFNFR
jgi:hypothetical protein